LVEWHNLDKLSKNKVWSLVVIKKIDEEKKHV
jgi:hypothetical protein